MKEKVILKSTNPEEYEDLVIECRVILNDKIGEYLDGIPGERKFWGYKTAPVIARPGKVGESIETVLKTVVDGKEYILSEEKGTVRERSYSKKVLVDDNVEERQVIELDYVITNINSTSNEQYITKAEQVQNTYELIGQTEQGYVLQPKYESRLLTQVDENIIIMTAWGSKAICLKGSYIVTYNAEANDYNTLEQGAFESTYTREEQSVKKMKRN